MTAIRAMASRDALQRPLPSRPPIVDTSAQIGPRAIMLAAFGGGVLSGIVHALIHTGVAVAMAAPAPEATSTYTTGPAYGIGFGLCGQRRCSAPELRKDRRDPEPTPVKPPKILDAALVPRLGMKQQDKNKLPELQAYEQREIVEDGVNLKRDNAPPAKPLKKRFRARKARFDRKNRSLRDLLDHVDDDPRKRARSVTDIVGVSDGEITGDGTIRRPGNRYVKRVRRELEREFVVPTHIPSAVLGELRTRIKVRRMGADGAILDYKIIRRSGNGGFDDAVLRLLVQYIPEEKGKKRLPVPDPDVLRYINLKGMKIDLLGARLR